MSQDVAFSCTCGAFQGVLHNVSPATGCHLVCYCPDCRAFARHMGQMEKLEPGGGSPLVQVLPAEIDITQGADKIACARMSPKGLHRWYTSCCNTPLANTTGSSKIPMAGLWRPLFAETAAFGPVVTHAFTKGARAGGGGPKKDKGLLRMLGGLAKRALAAYMNGTARKTPFFDASGSTVVVPHVLSTQERNAAYAK